MKNAFYLTLGLLACSHLTMAHAAPSDEPPRMEVLEEGTPPALSKDPRDAVQPEEELTDEPARPGEGRTTEVRSGKSTYYVKERPPHADPNAPRSTTQWSIKRFEAGGSKPANQAK